jgi:hypothetical protein
MTADQEGTWRLGTLGFLGLCSLGFGSIITIIAITLPQHKWAIPVLIQW